MKIKPENASQIETWLKEVNGSANQHTINSYHEVEQLATQAEDKLLGMIGVKKYLKGAKAVAISGGSVAKAYKYTRKVTRIVIVRKSSGWELISVRSDNLYANQVGGAKLLLTKEQDELAVAKFRTQYEVQSGG